jgi:hypothetical protein
LPQLDPNSDSDYGNWAKEGPIFRFSAPLVGKEMSIVLTASIPPEAKDVPLARQTPFHNISQLMRKNDGYN